MSDDDWREERLRARRQREAEAAAAEEAARAAPPPSETASPPAPRPRTLRIRPPSPSFGRTRTTPAGPGLSAFGLTLPPLNILQMSLIALGLVLAVTLLVMVLKHRPASTDASQSSAQQQQAVVQTDTADVGAAAPPAPAPQLRPSIPVSPGPIATTGADGAAGGLTGAGDQPAVTTPARWVEKPSDDEIAAAFPDEARATDDSGHAVVQCVISAAGEATSCAVQSETPAGDGFGKAALGLARKFKFKAKTVNGVAVDGGVATVALRFAR